VTINLPGNGPIADFEAAARRATDYTFDRIDRTIDRVFACVWRTKLYGAVDIAEERPPAPGAPNA
jgi:hypothetical protein